MLHIVIITMMVLNFYLLFYTRKNIYTWYLYHFLGGILPIIEIILLSKKKTKSTKLYTISVIILFIISIIFFSTFLMWVSMKDIFNLISHI